MSDLYSKAKAIGSQLQKAAIEGAEVSGILNPSEAAKLGMRAYEYHQYAKEYAKAHNMVNAENQPIAHNNPADAIRHCAWSMSIAREFGPEVARDITSMHEDVNPNSPQEHHMDFYNNSVGIDIAFDARFNEYEPLVAAEMALNSGMLISKVGQMVPDYVLQEEHEAEENSDIHDSNEDSNFVDDSVDGIGIDHDISTDF